MAASEVLVQLSSYQCSVPQGGDKVHKDECVYSFDTPESDGGIYVCLSSLLAVSPKYLTLYVEKNPGKNVFLHLKKIPKQTETKENSAPPEKKPTRLAFGVEGGFDVEKEKIEYEDVNSLVVTNASGSEIYHSLLPNPELPLNVQLSIAAILSHQGASLQEDIQAWEDKRVASKHADNLRQLDNGVKIPPSGWKCALCDLTENLWLNLTDGTILCGRKYFDGSGGNNHAVEYFQQTGYPLAVKLGTITGEGGDVFSYNEDDMVEDPKLKEHLQHFGINISQLEKTDKTMTELEIEANINLKAEWDTIQESGKKLVPLYGAGHTGMVNLGNSCYMNSAMQVLFSMEEFQKQYVDTMLEIFKASSANPPDDFQIQMAKIGYGLLSGVYSKKPETEAMEETGIRPQMFKSLVGRGHPEFSTNHQQDAQEFLLHFLDLLEKNEKTSQEKLKKYFTFQLEDRLECSSSGKVLYKKREELVFGLPLSLDDAVNKGEYIQYCENAEKNKTKIDPQAVVRLKIPFDVCLKNVFDVETIKDYYSTAIKGKTSAKRYTRFVTFPEYLVLQVRRFTVSEDWTPKKLDVSVDVPEELDLSHLRSTGLQPGEELLPDDDGNSTPNAPDINETYVLQLADMGFPIEVCRKAVYYTQNQGVEAAMNWVFENSHEDFASPLQSNKNDSGKQEDIVDPENLMMIVSMGFTEAQAKKALKITKNNVEAAAELILTQPDQLDSMDVEEATTTTNDENDAAVYKDGPEQYRLFAFISHMGTSTSCGHYVCHVKKNQQWVIYNDRKVALSESPPKDLGYLYFYKRVYLNS